MHSVAAVPNAVRPRAVCAGPPSVATESAKSLAPFLAGCLLVLSTVLAAHAGAIPARLAVAAMAPAPGDEVIAEVVVDLSGRTDRLGAYEAQLSWDPSALELVEVLDGTTLAFAGPQTRTEPGALVFSHFSVRGAEGIASLLKVRFRATGEAGQPTGLTLAFSVLDAAQTFASLLSELQIEPVDLSLGGSEQGLIWGSVAVDAAQTRQGREVFAEVLLDLSSTEDRLGAYEARLTWDPTAFELVDVQDGATPEFVGPNTRSAPGELVFSQFSVRGATGTVSLLKVRLQAIAPTDRTVELSLSFAVLDAAGTFTSLLPSLRVRSAPITGIASDSWAAVKRAIDR
ncbi:MAG: cohesin domain-containing protein [Candidatus Latescibacterota bacterium]|jgi:hypothetical protein